ncbi:kinase-like domain-containing protein [Hygrophoropsis aurantiaca]|uniref:Kinase-like domain-containing protein n=1 Tax=Hygrophoropsis aurantiaca TaxID=72124 RepID=A0ACB8A8D7_9AGAM|nr:kinase-like domain-containing protein [Hygrophoropsis aurantiaca]
MDSVPFTTEEIKEQCKTYQKITPFDCTTAPPNYVVLKKNGQNSRYSAKMEFGVRTEQLEQEYSWMDTLASTLTSQNIRFPKAYGIVRDDLWAFLVMEHISEGETVREYMHRTGTPSLPAELADTIVSALAEIRTALGSRVTGKVTPHGDWIVKGTMFPDNETGKIVDTVEDMVAFLSDRFRRAGVDVENGDSGAATPTSMPPSLPMLFAHGDLSSNNILLLPDGRLALIDFGMSCFAPPWWEWYALMRSSDGDDFFEPLFEAMRRKGMVVYEEFVEACDKLCLWYARFGSGVDIYERGLQVAISRSGQGT